MVELISWLMVVGWLVMVGCAAANWRAAPRCEASATVVPCERCGEGVERPRIDERNVCTGCFASVDRWGRIPMAWDMEG
jgi:hypothetical protein